MGRPARSRQRLIERGRGGGDAGYFTRRGKKLRAGIRGIAKGSGLAINLWRERVHVRARRQKELEDDMARWSFEREGRPIH